MNVAISITFFGMAIVFAFIGILAACIKLLESFRGEMPPTASAPTGGGNQTAAVIAAAIHAHRSKMKRM
jgi:sodium pump decarboxylase gamma subunit